GLGEEIMRDAVLKNEAPQALVPARLLFEGQRGEGFEECFPLRPWRAIRANGLVKTVRRLLIMSQKILRYGGVRHGAATHRLHQMAPPAAGRSPAVLGFILTPARVAGNRLSLDKSNIPYKAPLALPRHADRLGFRREAISLSIEAEMRSDCALLHSPKH